MNTRAPSVNIKVNFTGAAIIAASTKNDLIIGHRGSDANGNYLPLAPAANYPSLTAYRAYNIPAQSSVSAYLSYMKSLGFIINYGESNSLTFQPPTSVSGTSTITLTWTTAPYGFNLITGTNILTTMTQNTSAATATVFSASVISGIYTVVLNNVTGTFNTTNTISVNTINNNIAAPDPTRTDEIVMQVYRYAQGLFTTVSTQINQTTPALYIAYLNNATNGGGTGVAVTDVGFAPVSDTIPLIAPTTVQTLPNGDIALYFATVPENFGLVPNGTLGASTITQTTSNATGTIVGYLNGLTSTGIGVELKNVTGTFVTADTLSMTLDPTVNIFSLLNIPINYVCSPYKIVTNSDLTNTNYAPFFSFLGTGNAATSVNNNQFYTFGYVGNVTTSNNAINTLPVFDPASLYQATAIVGNYTSYQPSLGDISFSAAEIAAYGMGLSSTNDVPYNPMKNIVTPLPVQTDLTTVLKPSDSEAVLDRGWCPYVYDVTTGQFKIIRYITGLLYYPGTQVPDNNDYPLSNNQIIGLWKQSVFQFLAGSQFTNVRKSNLIKAQALAGLQTLATQFESAGMFTQTAIYNPQFTITDNTINPEAYDVYTPIVVAPELNVFNVNVDVKAYLLTFTVTQA